MSYVNEGWWHPNVKSGQVHDHPPNPGRGGWSSASHRLCEPVYTRRGDDRVPDDLRRWFEGHSVLAEQFNLRRIEMRWRVIPVLANLNSDGVPYIVRGGAFGDYVQREFRTHKAAVRYRDRLARDGETVLMQSGVLLWLTEAELPRSNRDDERKAVTS